MVNYFLLGVIILLGYLLFKEKKKSKKNIVEFANLVNKSLEKIKYKIYLKIGEEEITNIDKDILDRVKKSFDETYDLNEEWKDIPVTYGILNPKDTAQYIRIEKAFIDKNTSALIIAKNPDSIYYKDISVKLIREKTGTSYPLQMIDGNLDKHVRDTGIFANSPNYLYKIRTADMDLIPNEKYTLLALKNNGDTLTGSSISLVNDINIYLPYSNEKPVNLIYISNFNINWEGGDKYGYFDLFVTFHIKEKNSSTTNEWENKEYVWKVDTKIAEPKYRIEGRRFYRFLQDNLEENPDISRRFRGFDIMVRSVGREFKEYTDILHVNLGITSSQQLPTYTNMTNGKGVFSSINTQMMTGFFIGEIMQDSLTRGIYTKNLNFK